MDLRVAGRGSRNLGSVMPRWLRGHPFHVIKMCFLTGGDICFFGGAMTPGCDSGTATRFMLLRGEF